MVGVQEFLSCCIDAVDLEYVVWTILYDFGGALARCDIFEELLIFVIRSGGTRRRNFGSILFLM